MTLKEHIWLQIADGISQIKRRSLRWKERNELQNRQKMINKMAVVKSYLSKITLNYFLYTTNYWMKKLRRQSHLQDYQKE